MGDKRVLARDNVTGAISGNSGDAYVFPEDAKVLPEVASGGSELGTSTFRWTSIRAISGFRRPAVFGIAPMAGGGVTNAKLLYCNIATDLGYVVMRSGAFLTGISAVLSGAEAGDVTVCAFENGSAIPGSAMTITGGAGKTHRRLEYGSPLPITEEAVIDVRYSAAAGAAADLAATLEIED